MSFSRIVAGFSPILFLDVCHLDFVALGKNMLVQTPGSIIKSKQEAEIFKDLPLFDADILNNFIDEWFEDTSLNIDNL